MTSELVEPAAGFRFGRGRGRARAEGTGRTRSSKSAPRSTGHRYRVHYDIDGPRVRLGLLWFVGAVVVLFGPMPWALALYYGAASALAAANAARAWQGRGRRLQWQHALAVGAALPVLAGFGPRALGLGILAAVVAALAVPAAGGGLSTSEILDRAGRFLQVTIPVGTAVGCLVLLARIELWGAVSLIVVVSAYECGDYLIGSGAANALEGPLAGMAAAVVLAMVVAALGVPPFEGIGSALGYGIVAAALAPLGQLVASAVLPHARSNAPALRRLDSLLLTAPAWYTGISLFVR